MKTAALLPNEAKSPPKIISSEGATSLAKRLHSFISPARGDFIPANKKTPFGVFLLGKDAYMDTNAPPERKGVHFFEGGACKSIFLNSIL